MERADRLWMGGRLATIAAERFLCSMGSPLGNIGNVADPENPAFIGGCVVAGRGSENIEKGNRLPGNDNVEASSPDRASDVIHDFLNRSVVRQCIVMISAS